MRVCVSASVHIRNQENFPSVFSDFKRAAKTPESLQEAVPGGVTSAAPGDFNPYVSGALQLGPVLLQPKKQHEGTGGSVSCSSCRVAPATLWLLPVRGTSVIHFYPWVHVHTSCLLFVSDFCGLCTSVSLVCFTNCSLLFLFSVVQRAAWRSGAFISASSWRTSSRSSSSLHHPSEAAVS